MPTLYDGFKQSNSAYVPRFVGSEVDQLKSVADTLDQRYRMNEAIMNDRLAQVANEQYAPGDEHIGHSIYSNLDNLRDKIASSPENFENSTHIIQDAVRRHVTTNRARIEALRNAQEYNKYLDEKSKLGTEGEDFTPEWKGTVNPDGTFNRFKGQVEKRLDYDKKKETYFNDFEKDLIDNGWEKDAKNPGFLKQVMTGGISDKRIYNYLDKAFTRYKESNEYKQERRVLDRDNPNLLTPAQKDDIIKQSILATGLERVHGILKKDIHAIPEHLMKGAGDNEGQSLYAGTSQGVIVNNDSNEPTPNEPDAENLIPDGKGGYSQWINNKTGQAVQQPMFTAADSYRMSQFVKDHTLTPVDNAKTHSKLHEEFVNANNASSGMFRDFEHFKQSKKAADKSMVNVNSSGIDISDNQAANYTSEINRQANPTLYIGGANQPVTLEKFAKELGTSPSNIKFQASKVFHESPTKGLKGGYIEAKVQVSDDKVKKHPTTVRIPLNNEAQTVASNVDNIYKNSLYKGKDTYTVQNPYIPVDVAKRPLRDSKGRILAVWTDTYPLPLEAQQEGKVNRETIVNLGYTDGKGNTIQMQDENGYPVRMSLEEYKQYILDPRIVGKTILNSGQTVNDKDYKEAGRD